MNPHAATCNESRKLLRESRTLLESNGGFQRGTPAPVGALTGTLDEFEEFLDHNELELAWDTLASVAEHGHAPPAFWQNLSRAAALMRLPEKERLALQHAEPAVSCDRALATAHADAKGAYGDLWPFRIEIVLKEDGWHIDYQIKDLGVKGGGPHYIIDATTGVIVFKRYDQ